LQPSPKFKSKVRGNPSGVSELGLPENIRLGWKGMPETIVHISCDEKSFVKFTLGPNVIKLFAVVILKGSE
jgi:hypothetical protein